MWLGFHVWTFIRLNFFRLGILVAHFFISVFLQAWALQGPLP